MAAIRGKDTRPELIIRRGLHARGFRFRLHAAGLPGKPDLVFPKYRAAMLVNGCFWHGHQCSMFRWPSSRPEFWKEKISGNKRRDVANLEALADAGWRTCVVWEGAIRGKHRTDRDELINSLETFLRGTSGLLVLEETGAAPE